MFGKPRGKAGLTDRVRHVAERKPPPLPQETAPPRPKEERADRRPIFRRAAIIFDSGQTMDVAVKNMSAKGARIEFFSHAELPPEFILHEPTLTQRRRARVVWQRAGMAGLQFLD